jgi:hypothetical protein
MPIVKEQAENYPETVTGEAKDDDKILRVACERFKQCLDAESIIRAAALEDLFFFNGQQWLESILKDRADDRRPALTINKMPTFANQVINDMRQNRPAIKIRPVDTVTDPDTAEVVDGMIRAIMHNGDSKSAIDTGSFYQVVSGRGYLRIVTDYCDEKSFDQEIKLDRIENPFSVYFPIHLIKNSDYSDAPYCFVRERMSKEEFKLKYPDSKTANYAEQGAGDPNWETSDSVYLAEYFDVEQESQILYLLKDGTTTTEKPKNKALIANQRKSIKKTVKWYLMTEFDVLDRAEWPSKWIPIIPVLGQELNINGKKDYVSLIRHAKDPQRMYNYWNTSYTEQVALQPKAPWLVAEGQIENYKQTWQTANSKNHAVLVYTPTSLMGQAVPAPQRMAPPQAGNSLFQGIELAGEQLKEVTGIYDASLGSKGNETSGRAIVARQRQGDTSNFHFIDNQAGSVRHIGRILVDLIPEIYDAPRAIRVLGEDMTEKIVNIHQFHPDNKNPNKIYDLSVGKYDVVVDIGPSYETKRTETAQNLLNVIQSLPQIGQVTGDIIMRQLDFPLADEAALRIKNFINATTPGVIPPDDEAGGKPTVQEMQTIIQDLQKVTQAHQMTMQENGQLKQMIGSIQAQLKDKQDEISAKLHDTIVKSQTEIAKAQIALKQEQMRQAPKMAGAMIDNAIKLHSVGSQEFQAVNYPAINNNQGNQSPEQK